MNRIYIFLLLLTASSFSFADPLGQWFAHDSEKTKLLSIKIKSLKGRQAISYSFTYDEGRKFNEHPEEMPPIYIIKIDNDCYRAIVFDEHSSTKARVIMCVFGDNLYWAKISPPLDTPYTPNYEIFERAQGH